MEAVIFIVGLGVAQLMSKLGKTQGQGIAIWMVTMGAFLFALWYFGRAKVYRRTICSPICGGILRRPKDMSVRGGGKNLPSGR